MKTKPFVDLRFISRLMLTAGLALALSTYPSRWGVLVGLIICYLAWFVLDLHFFRKDQEGKVRGERVYPDEKGTLYLHNGQYGQTPIGIWGGMPPGYNASVNFAPHKVIEHSDETISVSQMIVVDSGSDKDAWCGYLEHGVWRRV